ncbi:MAG: hypothetical protein QNJ72_20725 [Pleurocapsa sp. MO_226.B13]|nr:hypothetical protein [Pleurocapsa sp. MO_226.B13]
MDRKTLETTNFGVVQKRGILGNILQRKLSQVWTSLTEQEYYDGA